MAMTLRISTFAKALKSKVCPGCKKEKDIFVAFCTVCMNELPGDIVFDLTNKKCDNFTQAAAFSDACIFLTPDDRR